jgi:hypothetical protein
MKSARQAEWLGVALILSAFLLARDPVYTSIKSWVVEQSGSIHIAVGVGITIVLLVLTAGILMFRRGRQGVNDTPSP